MEAGGTTVVVGSGVVFMWGFVAEGTGIGAPVGVLSQGAATFGGTLGATVAGVGALGKAAGVCH